MRTCTDEASSTGERKRSQAAPGAAAPRRPCSLWDPIALGSATLRNRIVKSAMGEALADGEGRPTPELLALYERWARGGAGLIITGLMTIRRGYSFTGREMGLHADALVGPLRQLPRVVQRHGGAIFAQLCHTPPQLPRRRASELGAVGPSAGFCRTNYLFNRALTAGEIRALVHDFGLAGARAREAGFDGLQLHGAHGYLISRFLSSRHNRRRDRWGGDTRRRLAFLQEIYQEIRARVGRGFPVTIKLNVRDGEPGGLELEEALRMAKELERWGFDAIEVSAGTAEVGLGFFPNRGGIPLDLSERWLRRELPFLAPAMPLLRAVVRRAADQVALHEEAYFLPEAQRVAGQLRIPVICVGGIRSLQTARHVLQSTPVSMVAMARPLLCEPSLPAAWQQGRRSRARCTSCNRCFVSLGLDRPLRCWQPFAEVPG